jgi:hypothetical protein
MLPLCECAAESIADPATAESIADLAAAESATEPLHSVADPATTDAALTETSCLCVQV